MVHQAKKGTKHRADLVTLDRALVVKLGSIAVHAEEIFDELSARKILLPVELTVDLVQLFTDEAVARWVKEMGTFLPLKRTPVK